MDTRPLEGPGDEASFFMVTYTAFGAGPMTLSQHSQEKNLRVLRTGNLRQFQQLKYLWFCNWMMGFVILIMCAGLMCTRQATYWLP